MPITPLAQIQTHLTNPNGTVRLSPTAEEKHLGDIVRDMAVSALRGAQGRVHWKQLTLQPSNFELRPIYWLTTELVAQCHG